MVKLSAYLPAFVMAAVLANQMRHHRTAAVLAGGQRFFGKRVMAAALVAAASGFVLLGNAHMIVLFFTELAHRVSPILDDRFRQQKKYTEIF